MIRGTITKKKQKKMIAELTFAHFDMQRKKTDIGPHHLEEQAGLLSFPERTGLALLNLHQ